MTTYHPLKCPICGEVFAQKGAQKTCSKTCSKEMEAIRHAEYYHKNSEKWKWYAKNAEMGQLGTCNISGHARRNDDGDIDFYYESNVIKKEFKRLRLKR